MILLGNLLKAIADVLGILINFFIFLFIARAVLSWVNPDPYNVIVRFIYDSTDPILNKIRAKVPPLGMLDLSVFIVIIALYFLDQFLVESLRAYGILLARKAAFG